jgi:DnaK suppressor protein
MDDDRARELLARERERIEHALAQLHNTPDEELSHTDQHLGDAGSELFENERDQGLSERLREELEGVERAEQRLAEGTFGISVKSGQPIPDDRLEAMPWADRTVEEQSRLETGR